MLMKKEMMLTDQKSSRLDVDGGCVVNGVNQWRGGLTGWGKLNVWVDARETKSKSTARQNAPRRAQ